MIEADHDVRTKKLIRGAAEAGSECGLGAG
jgi:hypothetical protein